MKISRLQLEQSYGVVILSEAKDLTHWAPRFFADAQHGTCRAQHDKARPFCSLRTVTFI